MSGKNKGIIITDLSVSHICLEVMNPFDQIYNRFIFMLAFTLRIEDFNIQARRFATI